LSKALDSFEKWEKQGLLKEKLDLIEKLASKNITQVKIAKALGISEKTLQKLKNKHVDFARAFSKGESDMKDNLISAIYSKAIGFQKEETQTLIETYNGRSKKKVVKNKKYYPPDLSSAKYLLITKFGRNYNDKKDELDIMEKRIDERHEEWD
jgi:transcriptional regulator with XRE-family HTH domain